MTERSTGRQLGLPPSRAAQIERLSRGRAKWFRHLRDAGARQLHPVAGTLSEAERATIAAEIEAEAAEALARWGQTPAAMPARRPSG